MMQGIVSSGLGKAAGFVSVAWVHRELSRLLEAPPFPGTLNLRISAVERAVLFDARETFLRIADPQDPACAGYVKPVRLRARGEMFTEAWMILPELTAHPDVIEIVSPQHLRAALDLRDGDLVELDGLI